MSLGLLRPEQEFPGGGAFGNYEAWERILHDEREKWCPLAVLDHPAALKDADWAMLRMAFVEARAASEHAAHVGPWMLKTAAVGQKPGVGVSPEQLFKWIGFGDEICQPLLSR